VQSPGKRSGSCTYGVHPRAPATCGVGCNWLKVLQTTADLRKASNT